MISRYVTISLGGFMRKNILILYTNYGTGHYMAAKAIYELLKDKYKNYKIEILDALSYSRPIINKIFAKVGNIVATKFRHFRGKLYKNKMYENYFKDSFFFKLCIKIFWTKKLQKKLTEFNPDIIISTQVGPTGLIAAHKEMFNIKLISVYTDYSIHRMYTIPHEFIDKYCVPNIEIKNQMIELGINKNKIEVTGIPVHYKFCNNQITQKQKLIRKTNIKKPLFLFVCGGGLGYNNGFKYFKKLLKSNYDFYYIFVAGKNKSLLRKAQNLVAKSTKDGQVLGYVNNMDELMNISDIVIGKPGGILTSETLNMGIPLCAIEPIPGQETNNSKYIYDNNFGFYITNLKDFDIFLERIKNKEIDLKSYEKNIKSKFHKFSFLDINKL